MKNQNYFVAVIVLVLLIGGAWLMMKRQRIQLQPNYQNQTATGAPTQEITPAQSMNVSNGLTLKVSEPNDGQFFTSPIVAIKGSTFPNAQVFINDMEVKADTKGNFATDLTLDVGENLISISANDDAGNYAVKELTVNYNPSQ